MMSDFFFIRLKSEFISVKLLDVCYITAVAHHVKIHTERNVFIPHLSLKRIEAALPPNEFARVNRGVLVALRKVVSFDKDHVYLKDASFSFGDTFKEPFLEKIVLLVHKESKAS